MSSTQPTPPADREALERDIVRTRERLAETADALAAKADVKAQAQHKVDDLKAQAQHKVDDVKAQAQHKVTGVKDRAVSSVHGASDSAPGSPKAQGGALAGAVVVAVALTVWLVVRRGRR
ncbi:DUF3618 domain-containing protein [Paenibacillus sp. TRM 82003]|uniref:DUF3618 domain-containing protein n=1 Tax=Kineococcus sp. TRM81007 TaxID=2925831 RepID=UPI001F593AA0|nr:DUF3618 domain-containing protein [Kineococcus sp. TRM81007]MCI2237821.1 DUF3618 domain-containing protein [Kineococcus sp. TRM81007]MCI3926652.1 DUF3618 domain-containing protein [Paenibacillus sp. TRM 82003]